MSLCLSRLQQERKLWRKDHPFGFYAKPRKAADGGLDLMAWDIGIPGKKGTNWEGGLYPVTMTFSSEFPAKPPKCQLPSGFYHPNVYPSGTICLSILNESQDWKPTLSVKDIALGIQELLINPNIKSPAQSQAYEAFRSDRAAYDKKILAQAKSFTP